MNNCYKCGADLSRNEIGLHKRLIGKQSVKFLCIHCLAEYYDVTEELLREKIQVFKDNGCTLFE